MSVNLAGFPDITAIDSKGRHTYLEVKGENGRLSKIQEMIHTKMVSYNLSVHTVRSVDEVKEILKETEND